MGVDSKSETTFVPKLTNFTNVKDITGKNMLFFFPLNYIFSHDPFASCKYNCAKNFTSGLFLGGQHHTLVLTNDNKCLVIGRKDYGRLGIGPVKEDVQVVTPIKSLDGKNIVHISCGESCSFALSKDGKTISLGFYFKFCNMY